MASTVYFSDLRTRNNESLTGKMARLLDKAGFNTIDFKNHYAAIKMHFGESGNLAFLRPNWAKVVVDKVKEGGGKAFLTDANTLYVGSRKNAIDHLETAAQNGFNLLTTGASVIIADGLKGDDEAEVPVNGKYVKTAKIGRAIMDADVFISLTHFKGHEATGFGGALKNIGMGSGSRRGKMEMHNQGKPKVLKDKCIGCHKCTLSCAHSAQIFDENRKCSIDMTKCVGCGRCLPVCPVNAIVPTVDNSLEELNCRMMEYAKAVVQNRPCFHISIVIDVSPLCDCYGCNDSPVVPNIGLFASFDPVALDKACADAVNNAPINPNTALSEAHTHTHDHFRDMHPDTNWKQGLEYAESIGLGTREYELVTVK